MYPISSLKINEIYRPTLVIKFSTCLWCGTLFNYCNTHKTNPTGERSDFSRVKLEASLVGPYAYWIRKIWSNSKEALNIPIGLRYTVRLAIALEWDIMGVIRKRLT